jgi:8-amino-7-oxononanoate synthase
MPDFRSALYLGLRHGHGTLVPWQQITTGRPAALGEAAEAESLERGLARLVDCDAAALGTSTLHLFLDLFDMLANDNIKFYIDEATYPIARRGIQCVTPRRALADTFRTHNPAALAAALSRSDMRGRRPVVVTDGLNPLTGRPAPLPDYLRLVKPFEGLVVVDDTQALGILGRAPASDNPYGYGGGGTPSWFGLRDTGLVLVSSLAKGFGAPLALIAGAKATIAWFKEKSQTRIHCSPPSMAALAATRHALMLNATDGDALRFRLHRLVQRFRTGLVAIGLSASGGCFPIQTLKANGTMPAPETHAALERLGVTTVLHHSSHADTALLSFLICARHTDRDIAAALDALRRLCKGSSTGKSRRVALSIQERDHG